MSSGTLLSTGGVVSTSVTVTLKLAVALFPCLSVAEQLTVVVPTGNLAPESGLQSTGTDPSMLSLALAENVTTFPLGSVVVVLMSSGRCSTGGVESRSVTVTLKLPVALLPCESFAVQVTVVVPTGNLLPESGLQSTGTDPSRLSVAVAENVTTFPLGSVVVVLMSPGRLSTGGVLSTSVTVTLKLPVALFPCASVAEQVTVVVPTGK